MRECPLSRIEAPGDAIVRITTAAVCGSDLHMYEERSTAEPGVVFGHENLGVAEEIGKGVVSIKKGDRVVIPFKCGLRVLFQLYPRLYERMPHGEPRIGNSGLRLCGHGVARPSFSGYLSRLQLFETAWRIRR